MFGNIKTLEKNWLKEECIAQSWGISPGKRKQAKKTENKKTKQQKPTRNFPSLETKGKKAEVTAWISL